MSTDGVPMEFDGSLVTPTQQHIRSFQEIPDIITLDVPPVEYIVPALGIARNTITLWAGADGDAKTYLVQALAVAGARR